MTSGWVRWLQFFRLYVSHVLTWFFCKTGILYSLYDDVWEPEQRAHLASSELLTVIFRIPWNHYFHRIWHSVGCVDSNLPCGNMLVSFNIEKWTFSLRFASSIFIFLWRIESNFSMSLLLSAIVISTRNSCKFTLVKWFMILVTRITSWPSFIQLDCMSRKLVVGWRYLIYTLYKFAILVW